MKFYSKIFGLTLAALSSQIQASPKIKADVIIEHVANNEFSAEELADIFSLYLENDTLHSLMFFSQLRMHDFDKGKKALALILQSEPSFLNGLNLDNLSGEEKTHSEDLLALARNDEELILALLQKEITSAKLVEMAKRCEKLDLQPSEVVQRYHAYWGLDMWGTDYLHSKVPISVFYGANISNHLFIDITRRPAFS